MNREIKFRAWCTPENIMLSNKQLSEVGGYYYDFGVNTNIDGYTLMQYTGLKDKNGVEIYEGDIVYWKHIKSGKETKHIVEWTTHENEGGYYFVEYVGFEDVSYGEVIGNIYENPELIK